MGTRKINEKRSHQFENREHDMRGFGEKKEKGEIT